MESKKTRQLNSELAELLRGNNLTLSCAESLTAGLLSSTICELPGASFYYAGGITAYSEHIKRTVLGVSAETINQFGVVSRECAIEMAQQAQCLFATDCSISTTGWAGPALNPDEPVGVAWIAIRTPDHTLTRLVTCPDLDRNAFRTQVVAEALELAVEAVSNFLSKP